MGGLRLRILLLAAALLVAAGTPAWAQLRISNLDVFLNDADVTTQLVVLGTIPPSFQEGIHSGIPAHLRVTFELWQYNRLARDRRIAAVLIERHLSYNVVTKEYKVAFIKGEVQPPHVTRDLRDAQRALSQVRAVKLAHASDLDPAVILYVRVRVETALNGENTFVARMAGTAAETVVQSEYRTLRRIQ